MEPETIMRSKIICDRKEGPCGVKACLTVGVFEQRINACKYLRIQFIKENKIQVLIQG